MKNDIEISKGTRPGLLVSLSQRAAGLRSRVNRQLCMLDARMRTLAEAPEEGAATAEYAVVLVAATGFAAVLVAILKSDAVKTLLSDIIKKALSLG